MTDVVLHDSGLFQTTKRIRDRALAHVHGTLDPRLGEPMGRNLIRSKGPLGGEVEDDAF
jgi:hypothetical protein